MTKAVVTIKLCFNYNVNENKTQVNCLQVIYKLDWIQDRISKLLKCNNLVTKWHAQIRLHTMNSTCTLDVDLKFEFKHMMQTMKYQNWKCFNKLSYKLVSCHEFCRNFLCVVIFYFLELIDTNISIREDKPSKYLK